MYAILPAENLDDSVVSTNVPTLIQYWVQGNPYYRFSDPWVVYGKRVYECYESINPSNIPPPQDTEHWFEFGYSNPYKPFDYLVNSQAEHTGTITYTIVSPSYWGGGVAFINLVNVLSVRIVIDGVYDSIKNLQIQGTDTYSKSVVFLDLPKFSNAEIDITLTPVDGLVPTKVGQIVAGKIVDLGISNYGVSAGIIDYSTKEQDDFGNFNIIERDFSSRNSVNTILPADRVDNISAFLSSVRSTPVAWITTDNIKYTTSMVTYGFYRDYSIRVPNCEYATLDLSIEGLI